MSEKDLSNRVLIKTADDLALLIERIQNGIEFAEAFVFETDELYANFFEILKIDLNEFKEKYFYYDYEKKLHISESHDSYVWISTMGLISKNGREIIYDNKYMRAYLSQYIVIILLLEKAIFLSEEDSTYDIDNPNYEYLAKLTLALFQNTIFYFEILCKAYLSLSGEKIKKTHKLYEILKIVKKTMYKLGHNNTGFHAYVVVAIEAIVKHISTIPNNFEEHNVKYDDNSGDHTVIRFDSLELNNMLNTMKISNDFIVDYYFCRDSDDVLHLEQGLYERLLNMAKTEEDRESVKERFAFLKGTE